MINLEMSFLLINYLIYELRADYKYGHKRSLNVRKRRGAKPFLLRKFFLALKLFIYFNTRSKRLIIDYTEDFST